MERLANHDIASSGWKPDILPLNYNRKNGGRQTIRKPRFNPQSVFKTVPARLSGLSPMVVGVGIDPTRLLLVLAYQASRLSYLATYYIMVHSPSNALGSLELHTSAFT